MRFGALGPRRLQALGWLAAIVVFGLLFWRGSFDSVF